MSKEIFIAEFNPNESRHLIIESDKHSVWAYVLNSENQIEFEGFICSLGTLVDSTLDIERFINNELQPPLSKNAANEFSIQKGIQKTDFKIDWCNNLINIYINEVIFAIMDTLNQKCYSKSISESGAYGIPLTVYNDTL